MNAVKAEYEAARRPGWPLTALAITTDANDATGIADIVALTCATFGRLDVVVNNAGYMESFRSIAESDPEEWWKIWTVIMRGTYKVTRGCLPLLLERGGDRTIKMTSIGGHDVSAQTTKFAIMPFTELIMAENAEKGILAYPVHPGAIPMEMSAIMPQKMIHVLVDTLEVASHAIVWVVGERKTELSHCV
ncbi:uncharacterized protein FIBRA_02328 [Fibroporia radiculosa]|uniref:Oxidoreductase n=1 Tax=Fibroporia radiculosa TaxID=599839 RepID=J4G1L7_9APHY|nr:uncharacterized protein FIBRA_02328 [Fibroporia radiculosa]CCM00298.1 predicted protein [Fibroporia radiculosa]